jgi:uncharacterized protein YkuJ
VATNVERMYYLQHQNKRNFTSKTEILWYKQVTYSQDSKIYKLEIQPGNEKYTLNLGKKTS